MVFFGIWAAAGFVDGFDRGAGSRRRQCRQRNREAGEYGQRPKRAHQGRTTTALITFVADPLRGLMVTFTLSLRLL